MQILTARVEYGLVLSQLVLQFCDLVSVGFFQGSAGDLLFRQALIFVIDFVF